MGEVSEVRGEGRKKEALKCITHITGCRCPLKATSQPCAPCHSNPEEGLPPLPPVPCIIRQACCQPTSPPLPPVPCIIGGTCCQPTSPPLLILPAPCIIGKAGRQPSLTPLTPPPPHPASSGKQAASLPLPRAATPPLLRTLPAAVLDDVDPSGPASDPLDPPADPNSRESGPHW